MILFKCKTTQGNEVSINLDKVINIIHNTVYLDDYIVSLSDDSMKKLLEVFDGSVKGYTWIQ